MTTKIIKISTVTRILNSRGLLLICVFFLGAVLNSFTHSPPVTTQTTDSPLINSNRNLYVNSSEVENPKTLRMVPGRIVKSSQGSTSEVHQATARSNSVKNRPVYFASADLDHFRDLLSRNFDVDIVAEHAAHGDETILTFLILPDGSMTEVSAKGRNKKVNEEAINSLHRTMRQAHWVPEIKDGRPSAVRFRCPLMLKDVHGR